MQKQKQEMVTMTSHEWRKYNVCDVIEAMMCWVVKSTFLPETEIEKTKEMQIKFLFQEVHAQGSFINDIT